MPPSIAHFLAHAERYVETVEPAIRFLQRRDPSLALRIVGRAFLPEGRPRFARRRLRSRPRSRALAAAFGTLGTTEQARYLASLYVDDLADVWRIGIDPRFELARYAERLAASAPTFDPLHEALDGRADARRRDAGRDHARARRGAAARRRRDDGAVPGQRLRRVPNGARDSRGGANTTLVLGGGWVNTELRALREPRVFDYFDYVTLDDGERPLLNLLTRLRGPRRAARAHYVREAARSCSRPTRRSTTSRRRTPASRRTTACRSADYVSVLEMLNPMHRFWSDGRWNKITLAHGCYWKKCTFCDVSLDYIGRYDRPSADVVVQRIAR